MMSFRSWQDLKTYIGRAKINIFDSIDTLSANTLPEGTHGDKIKHQLDRTDAVLARGDFELKASWAFCPQCQEIRWKKLTGFNGKENTVYVRDFIKKGKLVPNEFEKSVKNNLGF